RWGRSGFLETRCGDVVMRTRSTDYIRSTGEGNMQPNVERAQRRSRAESKEATKQSLLYAGLIELVEHGLDAPSLDAICARAGYTRGAFYVHFKDREDFFVAVMDWALTGILLGVVGADGAGTDLRSAVGPFSNYLGNPDF